MKNIRKKIIVLLATMGMVTFGCDNSLEEVVYSDITEQNFDFGKTDYLSVVGAAYVPLRNLWGMTQYYTAQETSSDIVVMPANLAGGWDDGGVYRRMHLHEWNTEQAHVGNMWREFYRGVIATNRVLEQIDGGLVVFDEPAREDAVRAELRTLRALYYWLILDNFGDAPLITTTATDELPGNVSRDELFEFAVSEIIASLPSLSEDSDPVMYGRMNKWGGKALLANIYLNAEVYTGTAAWDGVLEQTNDIIESGRYRLDDNYRDVFATENSGSPEIIFAIPFDETLATGLYTHLFSWHTSLARKFNLQQAPWGTGSAKGIPQFIDTYHEHDMRLADTWLLGAQTMPDGAPLMGVFDKAGEPLVFENRMADGIKVSESEGYRMNKFEVRQGAQYYLSNDFPFFRYAQVLMMRAEALLKTNRANEAATLVTEVRERAFKEHPSSATVTGGELQENSDYRYGYVEEYEIVDAGNTEPITYGRFLDELGWEFAWEAHRRRDLIRFGVFTKKSWLSHKPKGDYRAVFPIPQDIVNTNPNLEQHTEYIN